MRRCALSVAGFWALMPIRIRSWPDWAHRTLSHPQLAAQKVSRRGPGHQIEPPFAFLKQDERAALVPKVAADVVELRQVATPEQP